MGSKKIIKFLGIIPARGGSKSIKLKNIAKLDDKPLIEYTITAAKNSKFLSKFIVSTESKIIKKVVQNLGADVPFMRPKKLATDFSLTIDVVIDTIQRVKKIYGEYDYVVLLQPTSPFRTSAHIDNAIKLIKKNNHVDSLVSVCNVKSYHPLRMKKIIDNKLINYVDTGYENMNPRQKLPDVFIRNGSIYITKISYIKKYKQLVGPNCIPFLMNELDSINIDEELDFNFAKFLMNEKK